MTESVPNDRAARRAVLTHDGAIDAIGGGVHPLFRYGPLISTDHDEDRQ